MEESEATSAVVHVAALSAVLLQRLEEPETEYLATSRLRQELEALQERAESEARSAARSGYS